MRNNDCSKTGSSNDGRLVYGSVLQKEKEMGKNKNGRR